MAVQLPAQPPRNAAVEPRGSVHTGPYRSGRAAPPAMLLAWRASHVSMLLVLGVHGSDPRLCEDSIAHQDSTTRLKICRNSILLTSHASHPSDSA